MTKKERKIIMKKFKKVMAMGLATMAAVSAMSMSAMAAEIDEFNPSYEVYSLSEEETISRGFRIVNEDIYDLNGNLVFDMEDGLTPDGYSLDPAFRISQPKAATSTITPRRTTISTGSWPLPLNTDGHQGEQIGDLFKLTASEPDVYVRYETGTAPSINVGLVSTASNAVVDYAQGMEKNDDVYLNGYSSQNNFKLIASAQDAAGTAKIVAYTADDPEN